MYQEREFYQNFRRAMAKAFSGDDGIPALTSKDLNRPEKSKIVISAGARWTRIVINRPIYVWTPDHRQIDYMPGHHPGDLSADTSKPWNSCISGAAKLYAAGEWHMKTPLISGDAEGTFCPLIKSDVPPAFEGSGLTGADVAGAASSVINVGQLGGTAQSGADLGALVNLMLEDRLPIDWTDGGNAVTINAADAPLIVANADRRGLAFFNHSTGGQYIGIDTAVLTGCSGFLILPPNTGEILIRPGKAVPTAAIHAYASAAGAKLDWREGE
jgi:hypothetical protein